MSIQPVAAPEYRMVALAICLHTGRRPAVFALPPMRFAAIAARRAAAIRVLAAPPKLPRSDTPFAPLRRFSHFACSRHDRQWAENHIGRAARAAFPRPLLELAAEAHVRVGNKRRG